MKLSTRILLVAGLLLVAGWGVFWLSGPHNHLPPNGGRPSVAATMPSMPSKPGPGGVAGVSAPKFSVLNTNKLAYRLSNTTNSIRKLESMPHAILLANAFIDTDRPLDLKIPDHLRSSGNSGAYIVQARSVIDGRFRAALAAAGAGIVSYIPNNSYLVNLTAQGAAALAASPVVQAVLPYEPYYKIQSSLLGLAVNDQPLPPGTTLKLGVYAADEAAAGAQIEKLGAKIVGQDQSPFGPVLRVLAPKDWIALAQSPVVQFLQPSFARRRANDLSRVTDGISPDTLTSTNYLNLYGSNVTVAVNDSGIDMTHPDLTPRVSGITPLDLVDTNGHGTHVAGIIASSGVHSHNPPGPTDVGFMAQGSTNNADFRGKAPLARLFSASLNSYSDYQLQTNAATVGALISNNSWDYGNGDAEYDLAAASYDAATRDALPYATGSQPVLFVFAAGNNGGGDDNGQEGNGDSILSPGTAKNVITVGALEQLRNITNIVTDASSNTSVFWQPQTDSSDQVAWYSSRGNVGIGTEGDSGRFKPDLVSPGTFVVSTRSSQWDTNAYYNATNDVGDYYPDQLVTTNFLDYLPSVSVPPGTIGIVISILPNQYSITFPTNMIIYCQQSGPPDPINAPGSIDIITSNNTVVIPPGAGNCTLANLLGNGFQFAVGDPTNVPVNFDVSVAILVTNALGNLEIVLEQLNETLAPYYRYESGTSMSAADVSGVLALIQDYFTNQFQPALTPSPALMKALLINGSRSIPGYQLALTNTINFEGWGWNNITDSVPVGGLNNQFNQPLSSFFVEQNPTNALATGDRHTFLVNLATSNNATGLPLKATLVWTDPPGDPAAAIKLVNNLDIIITNLATGDVYFGNDISSGVGYNLPWNTNNPPNLDTINNVKQILLASPLATNYSVTVLARSVNVNAVTAQTNNFLAQYAPNIVQDFALVISVGEGEVTNAFTVTDGHLVTNPTGDQDVTVVTTTNTPLLNQFVGASSPLLGTNSLPLGTNTVWGPNGLVTIGQTNQWHFYIVTNTGAFDYTNAVFLTFNVSTLAIPRMGVFGGSVANATKPEADIDLFVTDDPSITNLNPVAISNCLAGVGNARASVANAGTQFVYYTNSLPGRSVYYIGVQSEDQMGSEYDFLPIFTDTPFGGLDQNGNQIVNGLLLPEATLPGNNSHPGLTNIFALAVIPMEIEKVTVTNLDEHQQFGDLVGALKFGGQAVILNNHDGLGNTIGQAPLVYDDSRDPVRGTTNSDGPGSLANFRTKAALGPWILSVLDNSAGGYTGQVSQLKLVIQPHRSLKQPGIIVSVPPGGWFIDYVDVPAGYTNVTFYGTNVTFPPVAPPTPIQMYEKFNVEPTLTDYDQEATLTNGIPPGNLISVGPPLAQGQYFIGLYNPNTTLSQSVFLSATLGVNANANDIYNYDSGAAQPLSDDAVTGSSIVVPNTVTQLVASLNVGLVINSPRISDYAFTLVSPTGQRVLLMEDRGGGDTNGAGEYFVYTNVLNTTATGGAAADTNYLAVDPLGSTVPITWNFYTVPDQMTVYATTNPANFSTNNYYPGGFLLYNTGLTNNPPGPGGGGGVNTLPVTYNLSVPPGISEITIIMNQFGNPGGAGGDAWIYTAGAPVTNYEYLMFTDDTNLASVPIKFAAPPFDFTRSSTNFTLSDFDLVTNRDYLAPTNIPDAFGGWNVPTNLVTVSTVETNLGNTNLFVQVTNVLFLTNNLVSVVTDPSSSLAGNAGITNFLALGDGTITRSITTVPGRIYNVTFWYRGPGIAGWWRGEGNGNDSSDPENLNNNGNLIGRFNFPAGEVGQAFGFEDQGNPYQFAGTNTYVQVPASPSLDVGAGGGLTVEGWINPTNLAWPQPLVEWLARVPTNSAADTNLAVVQGPVLDSANGHYYYLLSATNWLVSESWAEALGGHLATVQTANEENWIYDTFTAYGATNRYLWIGLTNNGTKYSWTDSTNIAYTNWLATQPVNCGGADIYTLILSPTNAFPGLWSLADKNGFLCGSGVSNQVFGVVEAASIPTNGVQFWISGTNWTPGLTNALQGCLFANIVDTNYVSHRIWSAPGLLTTNVYQHVALTFNTNSGIAALYLNGTNVATTNLFTTSGSFVPFQPKADGDVLLGYDLSLYTNNFYGGEMDEMSIYGRALSDAEISAIYQVSADSTNRLIGKFDPTVTPATGLAEALVTFGASSNVIYGVNDQWQVNSFTFKATSNSIPLTISGLEPGILLDSFAVSEAPETNLFYFPEQPLAALNGTPAAGPWTLQVWDSRAGAYVTNADQLVNWQLSFVLVSNAIISAALAPETPLATTIPSGQTIFYSVTVPPWAHEATNFVLSSTEPLNVFYFDPTNPPGGVGLPDTQLLTGVTTFPPVAVLTTNTPTIPLLPGQTYYLGVQNNGPHAAEAQLEVDYDILTLTNGTPITDVLANEYSAERYFAFDVTSNAYEATFQLLKLNGNADLVLSQGPPLPTLSSDEYGSFNNGTVDQNIYLLTNSTPVPLSAGRWYLGVINRGAGPVQYSVVAKELDLATGPPAVPNVITLTNNVPFTWTAGPGAALTNFFSFSPTNSVVGGTNVNLFGLRFELFNLSGNVDLTLQTNALPLAPPFFQTSQNPGTSPELILVFTNNVLTNLAAKWLLGVPNHEITNVTYSIIAEVLTNSYFPAFPTAQGAGGGAHGGRGGTVYHVINTSDSGPGSLRDAVNTAGTNLTVVFDVSGIINLASMLTITNSDLTIAGETAPGGGITVAGNMTTVTNVHDVIIRDVRFRRGAADDSFQFVNASNVIADHISAEWTSDNLVSVLNCTNVTVQWSVMADSLYNSATLSPGNPPTGSLLRQGGGTLSFHHNLYADNYTGSPRLGDNLTLDFVNNVIYNWGLFSGLSGGKSDLQDLSPNGCTNQLNYVCNYLIAGPDTAGFATNDAITNIAFFGGLTNALAANWIFQTNNFIDSDNNGVLNGANTGWAMFTNNYTRFARGFPTPPVSVDEAYVAYERVLDFAGVNLSLRDFVDTNIVNHVRYQTGRMIAYPPLAGMVAWWKGENNALDSVGGNNGALINGAGFTAGEVGRAFNFNGVNQYMLVSPVSAALNVGLSAGFTIEGWINPSTLGQASPIAEYEQSLGSGPPNVPALGVHFYVSAQGAGNIYANIVDTSAGQHPVQTAAGLVQANVWQHIALTYDTNSGVAIFYLNGAPVYHQSIGSFTPQTSFQNLLIGGRTYGGSEANPSDKFPGAMDEVSFYKRALSANEIASIYQAGSSGKFMSPYATVTSALPYLDTDQDGIPDFWEDTFTPNLVFVPSNNNDRDGDGYTDLEEFDNWLAAPHALTVTNTPVGVDLYQLCGGSGHLAFFVTNSIHGSVYLTNVLGSVTNASLSWSNSIAVFTPTNTPSSGTNYYGYASFDVYVTNLDTSGYFGPVTVSVIVSAVPIALNHNFPPVLNILSSGVSSDPTNTGGSDFYGIYVGPNAVGALFEVDGPTGPMAIVITNGLPYASLSSFAYYTNQPPAPANLQIAVLTNSLPVPLSPGWWYMSAVNESGSNVVYTAKITLLTGVVPPVFLSPTNITPFFTKILETVPWAYSCIATDLDVPPLPLSFALVNGPTNLTVSSSGSINWTPTEAQGPSTNTVAISVSNGAFSITNAFTIMVEESNLPPVPPVISNQVVFLPAMLVVTNTATDPDIPINPLTYALLTAPLGSSIDTNSGIITWTPTLAQAGSSYLFTTVVTDTNPWAINAKSLSATNQFYVTVVAQSSPGQPLTNVVGPNSIQWYGFKVPPNAIAATNTLVFASGPVNFWFSPNLPPSVTNATDAEFLTHATSGSRVITTNSVPLLVPGSVYFLGVQNANAFAVTNVVRVDFDLVFPPPIQILDFGVAATNITGTNGYLVSWLARPTYQFHLLWSPTLVPAVWTAFNGVISEISPAGTNGLFQYFDNGTQTGAFGSKRFYRLLLLNSPTNTPPYFLSAPGVFLTPPSVSFQLTNAAADWDVPPQTLNYSVTDTLAATNLTINPLTGVIAWTPSSALAGQTNVITTTVTDGGVPPRSITNTFSVIVTTNLAPSFSSVIVTGHSVQFQWTAITNDQFQVRWATNLPPTWHLFTNLITSTTGTFSFTDTNTALLMKFYQLILLP